MTGLTISIAIITVAVLIAAYRKIKELTAERDRLKNAINTMTVIVKIKNRDAERFNNVERFILMNGKYKIMPSIGSEFEYREIEADLVESVTTWISL